MTTKIKMIGTQKRKIWKYSFFKRRSKKFTFPLREKTQTDRITLPVPPSIPKNLNMT